MTFTQSERPPPLWVTSVPALGGGGQTDQDVRRGSALSRPYWRLTFIAVMCSSRARPGPVQRVTLSLLDCSRQSSATRADRSRTDMLKIKYSERNSHSVYEVITLAHSD